MDDKKVTIVDSLYGYVGSIPVNEYDVIYTYFVAVMSDQQTAKTFASKIFQIADLSGESAMSILEKFKRLDQKETVILMSYYLNLLRPATVSLGVASVWKPNAYAYRNVVA
jgi:hypothetical protein